MSIWEYSNPWLATPAKINDYDRYICSDMSSRLYTWPPTLKLYYRYKVYDVLFYYWLSTQRYSKCITFLRLRPEHQCEACWWIVWDGSATRTDFAPKLRFPTKRKTGLSATHLSKSASKAVIVNHNPRNNTPNLILIWTEYETRSEIYIVWPLTRFPSELTYDVHYMYIMIDN